MRHKIEAYTSGQTPYRNVKLASICLCLVFLLAACNIGRKPAPQQPAEPAPTLETQATTFPVTGITAPGGILKLGVGANANFWIADHVSGFCRMDLGIINATTCRADAASAGQPSFLLTDAGTGAGFVFVPDNSSKSLGVWKYSFNGTALGVGSLISNGIEADSRPTSTAVIGNDLYVGYIRSDVISRVLGVTGTPGAADIFASTSDGGGAFALGGIGKDLYLGETSGLTVVTDVGNCANTATCSPEATASGATAPTAIAAVGSDLFIADINSILHYNSVTGSEEVWATQFAFPTGVFAVADPTNSKGFKVYVADDPTAGAGNAAGYADEFAFGTTGGGTGVAEPISVGVEVAPGMTAPGGLVKLGNDWWITHHVEGVCRLDPGTGGLLTIATSTCKTNQVSPGQASFDPIHNLLYVPDNSAQGSKIYRYPYNPGTRTLGNPSQIGLAGNKPRPSGTALSISADGLTTRLFISYVRVNRVDVYTSTFPANPSTTTFTNPTTAKVTAWGAVNDRASESLTIAKNSAGQPTLYAATSIEVQQADVNCASNCAFSSTTIGSSAPVAVGSDGNNTIFIGEGVLGSIVLRYDVLTDTTDVLADKGNDPQGNFLRPFRFISAFGVETNAAGVVTQVLAADDPSAGGAPAGIVWRIANPQTTLTLNKTVVNDHGGTATAANFQGQIDGNNVTWGQTLIVPSGSLHTLTETGGPTGYASSLACVGGGTSSGNQITVPANQSVVCTFTNDDIAPQLTVINNVDNTNGGSAQASDFTVSVTGTEVAPASFPGLDAPGTLVTLDAGSYEVSSSTLAGYDTNLDSACTGDLGIGESATCTITHTSQQGTLIVRKILNNDSGGTLGFTNFSFSVNNGTPVAFEADGENALALPAGNYTITEVTAPGYTATYSNCDNVQVSVGGTATCEITNDDQVAHLTLVKTVVNGASGTAAATDWTLSATGPTPLSGAGGAEADVNAGVYTLSEANGPAGYTASAWSCSAGTLDGNQLTLTLGQSATCTITNTQITHLKLEKKITNDNGGTLAATDWTLSASGSTPISGAGGAESDVAVGVYTLSETGPGGYAASAWSCVGGTLSGNQLTLALGDNATCTIMNDDIAPQLKVTKLLLPASDAGRFNLTIDGTVRQASVGNNGTTGFVALLAGTHTVGETIAKGVLTNYTVTYGGACAANGSVTLAVGETKECTITNTRKARVTITKQTQGGNGTFPFTGSLGNFSLSTLNGTVSSVLSVAAGTHTIAETVPAGWSLASASCNDGSSVTVGNAINNIVLAPAATVTCTFTNIKLARLTIVNNTVGGNRTFPFKSSFSGFLGVGDFNLATIGTLTSGTRSRTFSNLVIGTYKVTETVPAGWTLTSATCSTGGDPRVGVNLVPGANVTCTFNNTKQ
jgi:Prealbumin-like fold domain